MKRKVYDSPELSVIRTDLSDILTTSGGSDGTDLPIIDEDGIVG